MTFPSETDVVERAALFERIVRAYSWPVVAGAADTRENVIALFDLISALRTRLHHAERVVEAARELEHGCIAQIRDKSGNLIGYEMMAATMHRVNDALRALNASSGELDGGAGSGLGQSE